MTPTSRSLLAAGLALLLAAGLARSEEPTGEPPPPRWSGTLGLSYLATGGNSETETLGLDLGAKRRPEPWGLELVAQFNRAEDDGVRTAQRAFAGLRGERALAERWSLFAGASAEQDEFAGLDLRSLVEAGGIYKALLGPRHLLEVDLGLTWTDEDRVAPATDQDSLGGLAGLGYEWRWSETAALTQRLVYYANFDDSSDWRADSLTALRAAINGRLAMKLGYEIRHRNRPIGDNDDTDTITRVSLVWSL